MAIEIKFRAATEQDLNRIVEMLADDTLGRKRERYEQPLRIATKKHFRQLHLILIMS